MQDSLAQLGNGIPEGLSESKNPSELGDESTRGRQVDRQVDQTRGLLSNAGTSIEFDNTKRSDLDDSPTARKVASGSNSERARSPDFTTPIEGLGLGTAAANSASNPIQRWHGTWILQLATLAWFALSLSYFGCQSLRFRWRMRHEVEAAPSHRKLLDGICERCGIRRRVRLLKSDSFEEPVAYGLFRWTIVVPAQVEKRLNRNELSALFSHELAHLTRGDIVWLIMGRVLTTCFAFQPLNFLARRQWQLHAQFQCDDWAVERSVDRLTLARSLTLVAAEGKSESILRTDIEELRSTGKSLMPDGVEKDLTQQDIADVIEYVRTLHK